MTQLTRSPKKVQDMQFGDEIESFYGGPVIVVKVDVISPTSAVFEYRRPGRTGVHIDRLWPTTEMFVLVSA